MDNRYEIAEQNGMSLEFADWFFDNKKDGCGNAWFVMMAAMWEGWKGRAEPPVPEIQADVAQAIENLKQKLVECNRYNYCADAVKGVEDACHAAMLQAEPVSNSDELPLDYLQGHKDGLEWAAQLAEANHPQTGDWLYDDPIDLARAIRKGPDMPTVQAGNYSVTPDGWISCSERMPEETGDIIVVSDGIVMSGISYSRRDGFYIAALEYDDDEPIGGVTHWMPLPEPPQEVK
ncbi:TPA: DUF551 domain-containing protein [Escherichia coli]